MTSRWQALLVGAVAIVFASVGFLFHQWRAANAPPDPVAVGRLVLAAELMGVDDKPQRFDQWRGKVLVVNFWATWCAPCREEIPGFIQLQERYRATGVQFVGVAIDQKQRVIPYAKDMGMNYPLVIGGMETMEWTRELGDRATVLPFTLVLDRYGTVKLSKVGALTPQELESTIKLLL
jgi:thiol-disulfide isomerase/thioredoxin